MRLDVGRRHGFGRDSVTRYDGLLFLVLLLGAAAAAQSAAGEDGFEPPPPQPIPFSHRVHVAAGLQCLNCHPIDEPGFEAGYPPEELCMACHAYIQPDSPAIQELARYHREEKPVPWVKIYHVPDYVWFSHESHVTYGEIDCATCHGPVAERDVIVQEKPTTMESCMDCHTRHQVSIACDLCHASR